MFQRYRQTWTHFLAFSFWQAEQDFRPEEHMEEIALQSQPFSLPSPSEKAMLRGFQNLAKRPWKVGRSPWELLVIQDYRTEEGPGTARTAIILLHHHALIDGYGVASVFREFSSSAYTFPEINIKLPLITRILAYLRIPYDISASILTSSPAPRPKCH